MSNQSTAAVYTLGCRVNHYESEAIAAFLRSRGVDASTEDAPGAVRDIYIVNTCAVTAESAVKSRKLLRRLRRINPRAVIAAVGCDAQLEPDTLAGICDIVAGSRNKLDAAAKALEGVQGALKQSINNPLEPMKIDGFERTRAYIKIEDGCNGRCAYCIIPSLRGGVSLRGADDVAADVAAVAATGCREVTLTGIETSAYGDDLPLLISRVSGINNIERIRLGSLDPSYLTRHIADEFAALPKLMPHFHISLQSGSSRVLAAMRRRYNAKQAADNLDYLRGVIPDVKYSADILTCFPGESDEDFIETLEFARHADFYHMHVFTYSPRPGTEAAALPQLPPAICRERSERLIALDRELRTAHHEKAIDSGQPLGVLFEQTDSGLIKGHTREFMEVAVPAGTAERGELRFVKPVRAANEILICEII